MVHPFLLTRSAYYFLGPIIDNANKRTRTQFVEGDPRRQNFLLGDRAAGHSPQEEVQQALAGRRIVEGIAHQRRLGSLVQECVQPAEASCRPLRKKVSTAA
jgi:hypothetical protein